MKIRKEHIPDFLFFGWLALVLLAFNNYISLWDQDEAAYAGFAKRMAEGKNFIIPDYYWSDIHRKPPLHFWLMSLSYKIFGINEFAVRFFSALAVWGSIFLIRIKGRRFLGEKVSRWAAMFMAGNVFIVMLGKMAITDGLLLFFYTLAGLSLWEYLQMNKKSSLWFFYLSVALGMLVKGPPILLWAGFFWILLWLFYPGRQKLTATRPWIWGWLALLPFGAWLWAAWQQNPDFVRWWADWYIFRRTHSAVINQTGPPGSYFVLFFLFGLAYLPVVALIFKYMLKNLKTRHPHVRFFLLWFMAGWLPYEFLPSKLPAYVLSSYPAMAFLGGMAIEDYLRNKLRFRPVRWTGIAIGVFVLLFIFNIFLLIKPAFLDIKNLSSLLIVFAVILITVIAGLTLSIRFMRQNLREQAWNVLLLTGLFWTAGLFIAVLPLAEPLKNMTRRVAKSINYLSAQQIVILQTTGHPPSLPFYLERYHPEAQPIFPENKTEYWKKNFGKDTQTVWIVPPEFISNLSAPELKQWSIKQVKGIQTGSVGTNDYLILEPRVKK